MKDEGKSKEQLIEEIQRLREQLTRMGVGAEGKGGAGYGSGSFQALHDLLDNANDLVQSVSPHGEFLYVNKKWMETLGYTSEEVKELDIFDVVHPDGQEHCRDIFQEVISGGKVGLIEVEFISKAGKKVIVEGNVNCRFENGKPVATRAIFRDITEKRKREAGEIIKGGSELLKVAELIQICNFFVPDEAVIFVTDPRGKTGEIFIEKGKILHASTGPIDGRKALYRMLGWETGVYSINQRKLKKKPTINTALEKCLLDGARELDEFNNLKRGIENTGRSLRVNYSDELMEKKYDEVSAEVISLAIKHKEIQTVLDKCKYTDLETMQAISGLLQKGILQIE